jgi:hypothetical protein
MDEIKKMELWLNDVENQIAGEMEMLEEEFEYADGLSVEEELGGLKYSLEWMLERVKKIEELKRLKNNIENRKKVID